MKSYKTSTWITVIDTEEEILEVEVSAPMSYDNGDFSYSGTHCTNGIGGVANCGASVEVGGDFEYDKSKYTAEEIITIDDYLTNNHEGVSDKLEKRFWDKRN